ncbi:PepSY domain-containing protein [Colwellia sp. C1TZA3]|uniref:PepSY domain-containing protein n=1 Tax=Colwellia sp. C1TZA3 TaxID=2508879 RepID=UPI0011BA259D|nr:PepSY domain-containing protein [Colwellia sp. C1TZA3]TWX67476.1 PepSY domain-containing protein [Colwellia sp. C1TZA3]
MENNAIKATQTKAKTIRKKPLKIFKLSHKLHKWLMLFIGAQFVIWSVTGAYMVFFDIDYIHGDSLIVSPQSKIKAENLTYSSLALFQHYPRAKNLSVGMLINREVYRFNIAKQAFIIDAQNGEPLSPLNKSTAMNIAKHLYTGDGEVLNAKLITTNPHFGLSARHLPVWQVNFDNFASPSLYISVNNGKVVSKRHQLWYLFDWMFRLHIMDYGDDEDVSNWLLFFITSLAFFAVFSGLILTYFKVIKPIIISGRKNRDSAKKVRRKKTLSFGDKS